MDTCVTSQQNLKGKRDKMLQDQEPRFAEPKNADAENSCVECGRTCGNNPWFIEVIDGGIVATNPGLNDLNDSGYMGCWAVGNECAKKFNKESLFKR